jgi:hypothetical protein
MTPSSQAQLKCSDKVKGNKERRGKMACDFGNWWDYACLPTDISYMVHWYVFLAFIQALWLQVLTMK